MNTYTSFESSVIEQTVTENDNISEMLRAGIKAAQAGNRSQARHLLLNVTEADSTNENAWLWLASISEYPEELLVFLKNVLAINPANERAVEWSKATKSLLAKTFVQRGIDAHKQDQTDFAKQYFLQAIFNDDQNELAWLWLASMTESVEEKMSHLQKVLRINPDNETAHASLAAAKSQKANDLLRKANAAAVSGQTEEANRILDEVLQNSPDLEDAWILKSYLTNSFDEKLEYFEKVLEINPANETAQTTLNSLKLMKSAVEAKEAESQVFERSEKSAVAEEEQFYSEIVEESQPEENVQTENYYENEPLELAPENPVSEYAENYEEQIFESEESANEDFYSQNDFEQELAEDINLTEETIEESAEEMQFDNQQIIEPFEETAAAESEYSGFNSPVEEKIEEYQPQEIIEEESFEAQDFENEEIITDEFIAENLEADFSHNGNGAAHYFEVEQTACPFCRTENEVQAFVCTGCNTVLTLSDLEMLLAHKDADAEMLRRAVEQMESEEVGGGFDADALTMLGVGCINLKNLRGGLNYLQKAAKLDANNVLLNSQVHSLAIRLAEIEAQEDIHRSMPQDRTIMVVDDSATVRKLISSKLEKSGHTVVCAVDGVEALEKLREFAPDLVLLDITMPRMDGYQVCKMIRNDPVTKDIPVVMISGKDGFFDKVRGRMAGTTGYITKPFGPETLMKTVEAFVAPRAEVIEDEVIID